MGGRARCQCRSRVSWKSAIASDLGSSSVTRLCSTQHTHKMFECFNEGLFKTALHRTEQKSLSRTALSCKLLSILCLNKKVFEWFVSQCPEAGCWRLGSSAASARCSLTRQDVRACVNSWLPHPGSFSSKLEIE